DWRKDRLTRTRPGAKRADASRRDGAQPRRGCGCRKSAARRIDQVSRRHAIDCRSALEAFTGGQRKADRQNERDWRRELEGQAKKTPRRTGQAGRRPAKKRDKGTHQKPMMGRGGCKV